MHPPGIPAVETERDLVHAARVSHHQVESRLKAGEEHVYQKMQEKLVCFELNDKKSLL